MFSPSITEEQFEEFSLAVGQSIFASPVEPASARGLLAFDIGIAATAMPIDENAAYWVNSVDEDILTSGYLLVPRLVVSKGLSVANISGSYARVPDTDVEIWGGALDVPIISGTLVSPNLSVRGSYAQITGVDELELKTYGAEVFLSMKFGPVTPYGAAGLTRTESEALIPGIAGAAERLMISESDGERFTLGVRISLLVPKLVLEATQAEERSYAAKFSFGL